MFFHYFLPNRFEYERTGSESNHYAYGKQKQKDREKNIEEHGANREHGQAIQ